MRRSRVGRVRDPQPDLLAWKPSALDRLYTPETLASDRARRVFVMPDRPGCGAGPDATPEASAGV